MSQASVLEYSAPLDEGITPNAKRLLFAGFFAILTAGVGLSIRGGILSDWAAQYGFSAAQNGNISGAGLTGFCFGVIIGGMLADKIGYRSLVAAAFLLHIVSAVIALAVPTDATNEVAYSFLFKGSFIFAIANGTLESVANPLIATLFPKNRTHYLNILHASWPAGLVLGGMLHLVLGNQMHVGWRVQLGLFLIPTVIYGLLFFGQRMPKSEAATKGLKFSQMFKDVGILGSLVICYLLLLFFKDAMEWNPIVSYVLAGGLFIAAAIVTNFSMGALLLFILFLTHGLVGSVELGTDNWIQNITGGLLSPTQGTILFIWTSAVMFALRFCAHFIEKTLKLSPIGLLLVCSSVACLGLFLVSGVTSFFMAMLALAVYAGGKTFFWPTMLAVASDRFPRTGAIAISIMGGIGMMSGGILGSAGLGYAHDRFATQHLQSTAEGKAVYDANVAEKPSSFLFLSPVTGLDGKKMEAAKAATTPTPEQKLLVDASQTGDRMTLKADAAIPATMAVIYFLLFIYFKSIGGYKAVHIATAEETAATDAGLAV